MQPASHNNKNSENCLGTLRKSENEKTSAARAPLKRLNVIHMFKRKMFPFSCLVDTNVGKKICIKELQLLYRNVYGKMHRMDLCFSKGCVKQKIITCSCITDNNLKN